MIGTATLNRKAYNILCFFICVFFCLLFYRPYLNGDFTTRFIEYRIRQLLFSLFFCKPGNFFEFSNDTLKFFIDFFLFLID